MEPITGITRGGVAWTPAFITAINQVKCIGCGRCYKVCPRDVFELVERDELELEDDGEALDDDFDDDDNTMVMNLKDAGLHRLSGVRQGVPKEMHEPRAANTGGLREPTSMR